MPDLVIVGAVESSRVAIQAARSVSGWKLSGIVTLPPSRAGRHSDYRDLSPLCEDNGTQLIHTVQINSPETIKALRELEPDLILVVGWSQLCKSEFLNVAPGRVLGYHPAALPRMRGRAAIPWTILNEEPITASTLFWMDKGADSGPIVEQRFFHVAPDETAESLYAKHMQALAEIVPAALRRIAYGDTSAMVQDERYATFAARRTPADGRIDWHASSDAIDRLIRAVGKPYPGAFTFEGDRKLTIWSSDPVEQQDMYLARPGQIVSQDEKSMTIKTSDGAIRVTEWDLEVADTLKRRA